MILFASEPETQIQAQRAQSEVLHRSALPMWAIYDRPIDYPDHIVARLHEAHAGLSGATDFVIVGTTLDEVRASLPVGLVKMERYEIDPPHIVEVWI